MDDETTQAGGHAGEGHSHPVAGTDSETTHSGHNASPHPVPGGQVGPQTKPDHGAGHGPDQHTGGGHDDHTGHETLFRNRFWICLILSIPVLVYSPALQGWFGYTAPPFPGSDWLVPVLSTVIFVVGGLPFLRMATWELRRRKPGMMTLISLAILVAFTYSWATLIFDLGEGFFWELVTLIDVMLLGHWLEMRSVRQASGALDELAKLLPDTAERIAGDGSTESIPLDQLQKGDRVLVRPGASIPADGEVVAGETSVDASMITGESRPVDKGPGDSVLGGTVNSGNGSLRVEVTATGEETALSGVVRLVREAQQSKSETQLLADRAASLLFYVALGAAALTAIVWTIAVGLQQETLQRVVTVLVIACPHALGLAVPLVVAITTSMSARNGILVRDRRELEAARQVNAVMFDKTGTLTRGEQGVVSTATIESISAEHALALAAAVEGDSEHMIARAIGEAAAAEGLDLPPVSAFEALKGRGVRADVDGRVVYVGGPRLLEHLGLVAPETITTFSRESGEKGQSVVYLVEKDAVTAAFALADVIRPESRQAIDQLHDMGIEVVMITGDSRPVAEAVAAELGVDQVFSEVLPEDKDGKVQEVQAGKKIVAMVGDGVNDAPALTRADVGIAIGSGTDVAIESAGLILVESDPRDVVNIINMSAASQRKMIQNIWWAAGYNIVAIPLAAGLLAPWGITISPAIGALAMSISTIIVAINAQTLRRFEFI